MKKKQQHPGGGADPWPHGAPLGGAPPGLGSWKRWVSQLPFLRLSLRDYGFCMATLLVFCLGSLFYQLSGGPPRFLLDLRQYLGNSTYLDDHGPPPSKVLPFPSQVVYNRVGKCGSRTVVLLLRILSEKHGFNLVTSDIHNKTRLTKNEQMELIKNISTAEQPYLFTRHVHFLNFSRFGGDQPVYINIIRDPVNRFLSNYFFRRFGDWRGEQNHMIRTPSMRQEERYLDINECILENYPECSNPRLFYIIPYFCGQHPRCRAQETWKHDCDREENCPLPRGRADSLPANEVRVRVLPLRQRAVPPAETQVRTEVAGQPAPSEAPVLHPISAGNRGAHWR
ncbi:uronyl 2-sulfotransferase isoform X3 [Myotis myotis]|uniref:uronyl 2-sulfotransferase isoform X3 n=1 Tax=Myotis myotis TaxID=51298 RepID=UPI00174D2A91|nr:uronyl 2-sulfotransferase isoform X3 [Myotis myotis]XP_036171885.1 uronyl 2-sulfotransferase isoform X3 [Myotis myotis]